MRHDEFLRIAARVRKLERNSVRLLDAIYRIERIIEIYDERFAEGSKTMATHELRLAGLEHSTPRC